MAQVERRANGVVEDSDEDGGSSSTAVAAVAVPRFTTTLLCDLRRFLREGLDPSGHGGAHLGPAARGGAAAAQGERRGERAGERGAIGLFIAREHVAWEDPSDAPAVRDWLLDAIPSALSAAVAPAAFLLDGLWSRAEDLSADQQEQEPKPESEPESGSGPGPGRGQEIAETARALAAEVLEVETVLRREYGELVVATVDVAAAAANKIDDDDDNNNNNNNNNHSSSSSSSSSSNDSNSNRNTGGNLFLSAGDNLLAAQRLAPPILEGTLPQLERSLARAVALRRALLTAPPAAQLGKLLDALRDELDQRHPCDGKGGAAAAAGGGGGRGAGSEIRNDPPIAAAAKKMADLGSSSSSSSGGGKVVRSQFDESSL